MWHKGISLCCSHPPTRTEPHYSAIQITIRGAQDGAISKGNEFRGISLGGNYSKALHIDREVPGDFFLSCLSAEITHTVDI